MGLKHQVILDSKLSSEQGSRYPAALNFHSEIFTFHEQVLIPPELLKKVTKSNLIPDNFGTDQKYSLDNLIMLASTVSSKVTRTIVMTVGGRKQRFEMKHELHDEKGTT